MIRTYLDANVLITGFRCDRPASLAALDILGDANREFVASQFLQLETLRKPLFYRRDDEIEFMETFFGAVSIWVPTNDEQIARALRLAAQFDLGAMDALHVVSALDGGVAEFFTVERPTKPICQVPGLKVISLYATTA